MYWKFQVGIFFKNQPKLFRKSMMVNWNIQSGGMFKPKTFQEGCGSLQNKTIGENTNFQSTKFYGK